MNKEECAKCAEEEWFRTNEGKKAIELPKLTFEKNAPGLDKLIKIMENSEIAKNGCFDNTIPKDRQNHYPCLLRADVIKNLRRLYTDVLKKILAGLEDRSEDGLGTALGMKDELVLLMITSGYRCLALNGKLPYAVGNSRHLYGGAADFLVYKKSPQGDKWVKVSSERVCEELAARKKDVATREEDIVLGELECYSDPEHVHVSLKDIAKILA